MRARHSELRPDMRWEEMDIRDLKFNEGDFDIVLDKGTMDAMLTSKGDVWVGCVLKACVFEAQLVPTRCAESTRGRREEL